MRPKIRVGIICGGSGGPIAIEALLDLNLSLTVFVPSSDSGGGGVIVGRGFNMPTSSDAERCAYAMRDRRTWTQEKEILFNIRYPLGNSLGLGGVRASNLLTAAFMQHHGDYQLAIDSICRFCDAQGSIAPMTKNAVEIWARYSNGKIVVGEHAIDDPAEGNEWQITESIVDLGFTTKPKANPRALKHLNRAQVIIISMGSLITTTGAALKVNGVPDGILNVRRKGGKVIYLMNTMTEPGQKTRCPTASAHLEMLYDLIGDVITDVVIHKNGAIDPETLFRYREEGAQLVEDDLGDGQFCSYRIHRADLLADEAYTQTTAGKSHVQTYVRHDPLKLRPVLQNIIFPPKK